MAMLAPAVAVRRAIVLHSAVGALLALVVVAVLALVGVGVAMAVGLAVVVGVAVPSILWLRQEATILASVGAQPLAPGDRPRLENLVEGLCVANGFRRPSLHLVDDAAPNMLMVGRHPRHGAMVVTSGLLARLGRVELEGLIAHELTRMRNRSTLLEGSVGVLVARPLGFAPGAARALSERLLDPRTNAEIDVACVALTRYPPGLAGALRAMRGDGRVPARNPLAFRHMWVDPPEGSVAPHDFTLDDRIAVLEEL